MFQQDRLSTTPQRGLVLPVEARVISDLVDYEMGGVAISDPSQGLNVQSWKCTYEQSRFILTPETGPASVVLVVDSVTAMSFTFDQNMRPTIAYEQNGRLWLWWWDTTVSARVFTDHGPGRCPRLTLDDKRDSQTSNSDIIFAYIKPTNELCFRKQRERFMTERVLKSGLHDHTKLKNVSMNNKLRLQFELV